MNYFKKKIRKIKSVHYFKFWQEQKVKKANKKAKSMMKFLKIYKNNSFKNLFHKM